MDKMVGCIDFDLINQDDYIPDGDIYYYEFHGTCYKKELQSIVDLTQDGVVVGYMKFKENHIEELIKSCVVKINPYKITKQTKNKIYLYIDEHGNIGQVNDKFVSKKGELAPIGICEMVLDNSKVIEKFYQIPNLPNSYF